MTTKLDTLRLLTEAQGCPACGDAQLTREEWERSELCKEHKAELEAAKADR